MVSHHQSSCDTLFKKARYKVDKRCGMQWPMYALLIKHELAMLYHIHERFIE